MSLSSESSVPNTTPKYLQFTDFTLCPPSVSNGMTVLFALLVLNVMQTVSLQLKIIPCDLYELDIHLLYRLLCNPRTLGQNT